MEHERYFLRLGAAFVRGRALQGDAIGLSDEQRNTPLHKLTDEQRLQVFRAGRKAGLKLHKFKRTMELPRVRRVLGAFHALAPASLLDVGSGRGTFLWPLLYHFPSLPVTAIDHSSRRAEDLRAVRLGGVEQLTALQRDATGLAFDDNEFDVVTMLEVLEHIPDPAQAVYHAVRIAKRFVVLSVPSKPDDNPEHIHLFDETELARLFTDAGAGRLSFDYVRNHLVLIANTSREDG